MSDIVGRLRSTLSDGDNMPRMKSEEWLPVSLAEEAAEEIMRLREALKPFSKILGPGTNMRLLHVPDSETWKDGITYTITYGDLRRAMEVFSE